MGDRRPRRHPRTIGWRGTVALALGGSNQSLFLIGALLAAQGTAAVPLLVVGLLLSWAALPGWTELILMWPERVGGIAATCAEAFRPYSPVLANLTGVCYWWGWIPTCGLTAILSASALHVWYLPHVPVHVLAAIIVVVFMAVNLTGVRRTTQLAMPIALAAALLAGLAALLPVLGGTVDWHRALSFHLRTPFHGWFGALTSAMAGLYLVGFAAPAFEAAACHVGETIDPDRNVPRAMFRAAGLATLYFAILPVIWLGVFGPGPLEGQLASTLGPAFAPLAGGAAKAAAVWFVVLNMFHGTLQPLAGSSRTLSQLAEDGLLPSSWARRNRFDAPWVTTILTAAVAIAFLQSGDPTWIIAAANLAYLIGIGMPSVAVWLLRRNEPERERPYRAPRGTVTLGLGAAGVWLLSTLLGFEQFGLPTVMTSLALCYAGSLLYVWRRWQDRIASGARRAPSLHLKLTLAMVAVIGLDGGGYLIAINHVGPTDPVLVTVLKDIFVAVALLTINVGLVVPGIISNSVGAVAAGARRLADGTLTDLTNALQALSRGRLDQAHIRVQTIPLEVRSRDEIGEMAVSFNRMQSEIERAAEALGTAREELRSANRALATTAMRQAAVARLGLRALETHNVDQLIAEVLVAACQVMGGHSAVLYEYGEDSDEVRARATHGELGRVGHSVLNGRTANAMRLGPGRDLIVNDWVSVGFQPPRMLTDAGVRATLAVAVTETDRQFGALSVNFDAPRKFQPDELDTLRAMANLLASATERERAAGQMRHRALHDPLTGLPNRALFVDRLSRALVQCVRRERWVGVLFLDMDYFKYINDSLGHTAGDELLRAIAMRLEASIRAGDTVARFGGDEFLVICEDIANASEAGEVARRIIDALREPFSLAGAQHAISTSIGIAIARDASRGPEDLIREADAAMYRAKEDGRDRFAVYDEVMRARATQRLSIESELLAALERDELRLAYQPVIDLASGAVTGVEALVRWEHPRDGLLLPGAFIPVAEQSGVIRALGEWVLAAAAAQAAAWGREFPDRPIPVAVNLSARQVTHHTLLDAVGGVLDQTKLDPSLLHLEITESVLMDPSESNIDRLAALKELGVTIVLDDFGTGYSSLAYVKRFPIDTLKIDQTFVRDLGAAEDSEDSIVEAIIAMAQGLRVGVIAEGVETVEQADRLVRLGATHAQGYLFSPAVSAAEISRLIAAPGSVSARWLPAAARLELA